MPRLEGKRSNTGLYILLLVLVLVVIILGLDLLGTVNLIPGIGPI